MTKRAFYAKYYFENNKKFGYDKVIMLAGGIGFGKHSDVEKATPEIGDKIVLLGGDNYRIGMGGGAVSSVATGEFDNSIELNAVQRSNPEMQKRVANAIRGMVESAQNPIAIYISVTFMLFWLVLCLTVAKKRLPTLAWV